MASPEANSKATALPQLPNVSQNVQYLSPEGGYGQAAARAASPPPRPHTPPGSTILSTESGNDPQNVDDPGFPVVQIRLEVDQGRWERGRVFMLRGTPS